MKDVLDHVGERLPWWWAEPWDQVGLLVGDPDAPAQRVFVSLDPSPAALDRAVEAGAGVLLTHHPPFREPPKRLVPGPGMSGVPFAAAGKGVALIAAHTNLDRSPEGADALPEALGLEPVAALEPGLVDVAIVVAYVPDGSLGQVRDAMAGAGAGSIGRYAGCSFSCEGVGTFTPGDGSTPTVGTLGERSVQGEARLEMVCAPGDSDAVVAACRAAHPYEEPVILSTAATLALSAARMGRVCPAPEGSTLGSLARSAGAALGVSPRVWGEERKAAAVVALAPGSGRSLVPAALAAGADVFVTGELRYHDALDAVSAGLSVIEAGHDATEWPLAGVLATVAAGTFGLDADDVTLDERSVGWWVPEGA